MTKNFICYIGNNFGFTFEIPSIDSFDSIRFVIREDILSDEVIVKTESDMDKITDNKYRVKLSAEDTDELMPLNYLYGLQVTYGTNVKTVLEGKFIADIDPARSDNE
jgi:hypothetical protein